MTPSKMTGSKNYAFNRQVKGVGRIQQSSGTGSLKEFYRRDAILTKLIEASALETLRLFKAGDITIGDLVDADRAGLLLQVANRSVLHKPLKPAVDAWLPNSAPSPQGRRRYQTSWEHFFRASRLRKAATVYDLARMDYARLSTNTDGSILGGSGRVRRPVTRSACMIFGTCRRSLRAIRGPPIGTSRSTWGTRTLG